MTEDTARLVGEIRARCRKVTSLVGSYESTSRLQTMPLVARGRFYYLSPDRCRSETVINGSEVVSVRNGSRVERRLPARKEIWRYDLRDLPQSLPLNYPIADYRDPFFAVDEEDLTFEGNEDLDGGPVMRFSARLRNWATRGLLDTRKGFSIPYQPRGLQIRMTLYISSESGLLRRIVGSDPKGTVVLNADYRIAGMNVPLDESLFTLEGSAAVFRSIDITDSMVAALNPDMADAEPSVN